MRKPSFYSVATTGGGPKDGGAKEAGAWRGKLKQALPPLLVLLLGEPPAAFVPAASSSAAPLRTSKGFEDLRRGSA